jgi:hypothetical protein
MRETHTYRVSLLNILLSRVCADVAWYASYRHL